MVDQDRRLWDRAMIDEGVDITERALRIGPLGSYQLEAAIAGCHSSAATYEATDWKEIADLYEVLERIAPGPVVRLNRAVAVAETDSPEAALRSSRDRGRPGRQPSPMGR